MSSLVRYYEHAAVGFTHSLFPLSIWIGSLVGMAMLYAPSNYRYGELWPFHRLTLRKRWRRWWRARR